MPTSKQSRAVVLLSGGMDSCVCAALAARDYDAAAVHVSYGQRTEERERQSFLAICERLGIRDRLVVRNEALRAIGGSALTDNSIAVPEVAAAGNGIPVTYVPFRNAHFLGGGGELGGGAWVRKRFILARSNRTVRGIRIAVQLTTRRLTKW